MTPDLFRNAYIDASAAGFAGTRAEFASFVLGCPSLFRGAVVASARSWHAERGELGVPARSRGKIEFLPAGRGV